jgi:hypothetical protein
VKHLSIAAAILFAAGLLALAAGPFARADEWPRANVYQRRAFEGMPPHGGLPAGRGNHFARQSPNVSSNWFQRPYPYHLDYYRMRYGGSYAPYFGNLYGPPQVVTAPPYYGPYGAVYGGFGNGGYLPGGGYESGYGGGYEGGPPGPGWCPCQPTGQVETTTGSGA